MTIFDEIESAIKEIAHGWTTLNKGKLARGGGHCPTSLQFLWRSEYVPVRE